MQCYLAPAGEDSYLGHPYGCRSFSHFFNLNVFKGPIMKATFIKLLSAAALIGGSTAVWAAGACCVAGAFCCGAMPCCL